MPKNIMKMMKPVATMGRNDFDLSHRVVNTINFGEIIPFLNIHTVPDGKYEIRTADLIRAIPMVTSPFMRAKQHIDLWFVPYNVLWSRFNEFMVGKDEKLSSAFKSKDFVPHVHLKELLNQISSLTTATDIVGQDFRKGAYRILDALGYPSYKYFFGGSYDDEDDDDKVVNLWSLLAYNFIWYTEYRQQYYDDGSHGFGNTGYMSYAMNADFLECNTADKADILRYSQSGFTQYAAWMCQMRYRCWKKDLFTGLFPSTQFGNVSTLPVGDSILIQNQVFGNVDIDGGDSDSATFGDYILTNGSANRYKASDNSDLTVDSSVLVGYQGHNLKSSSDAKTIAHDHVVNVAGSLGVSSTALGTGSLDVLALRRAEAVQIWRENALRAGNFVEDNFLAHYGVKPKSHMHFHPVHIGSIDAPLNIGDIDSHAQTGNGANQQLADVAGKGISSLGKGSFKFQTTDFGVILGLVSMLPETEYLSTGIHRENQLLEREDYYIQENARLGLEAVDSSTYYFGGKSFNAGYAPHDYGYKQKMDEVHLDFFNTETELGVFRSWTSPKYDVYDALKSIAASPDVASGMPLSCLYVNPELFDVNFAVGVENSRQFLVDYYFDIDAIQPMPVTGMPSY